MGLKKLGENLDDTYTIVGMLNDMYEHRGGRFIAQGKFLPKQVIWG